MFASASTNCNDTGKHLFILSGQSNMVRFDPEISLIPALEEEYGSEKLIVVKDAMGSQSISRWYKGWESSKGTRPDLRGDLYERLMDKVFSRIKGEKIATVTFIWAQGERDARISEGEQYAESFKGLINQLKLNLQHDEINVVIARLSDFDMQNSRWPHWTFVRDTQMKLAAYDQRIVWINTDDLNDGLDENGNMLIDDLHFSVEGYKVLGERFAKASIELIQLNN